MEQHEQYLDWAREVLHTEADCLNEAAASLDTHFVQAAEHHRVGIAVQSTPLTEMNLCLVSGPLN